MFNVIRIPTKFSKTIKRFSEKEKAELVDLLISIWDWKTTTIPDTLIWDTVWLIYWEWMNMESKNWNKPEKPLIQYSPEYVAPSMSDTRVEYSRVEYNRETKVSNLNEQSSKKDKIKNEIDEFQELLKEEITKVWLAYQKWKYERERIKNILTWKDFWELAERVWMTRQEFAINIMKISLKLDFWNWKIYNATTIYKNYAMVYNEAIKKKLEIEQKKNRKITVI